MNHWGKVCTPWQVRRELANYLAQFSVKFSWECYTPEEYHALVNRRKKRKRRKKDGSIAYDSVESKEVTWREDDHLTSEWSREVDHFARKQQEGSRMDQALWLRRLVETKCLRKRLLTLSITHNIPAIQRLRRFMPNGSDLSKPAIR